MYKKKTRTPSTESKIEKAMVEANTFSLYLNNPSKFKLVTELITYHLLKDYEDREILLKFAELLPKVKNALHKACRNLNKSGRTVYKGPKDGRLEWITLDPTYRGKAMADDSERGLAQLNNKKNTTVEHLKQSDPNSLWVVKELFLKEAQKIGRVIKDKKLLEGPK